MPATTAQTASAPDPVHTASTTSATPGASPSAAVRGKLRHHAPPERVSVQPLTARIAISDSALPASRPIMRAAFTAARDG